MTTSGLQTAHALPLASRSRSLILPTAASPTSLVRTALQDVQTIPEHRVKFSAFFTGCPQTTTSNGICHIRLFELSKLSFFPLVCSVKISVHFYNIPEYCPKYTDIRRQPGTDRGYVVLDPPLRDPYTTWLDCIFDLPGSNLPLIKSLADKDEVARAISYMKGGECSRLLFVTCIFR